MMHATNIYQVYGMMPYVMLLHHSHIISIQNEQVVVSSHLVTNFGYLHTQVEVRLG
jgi:hypothetical protein